LKAAGFDDATTDDVRVHVGNVLSKADIRSGDRRLMKCPKRIYQAAIKHNTLISARTVWAMSQGQADEKSMKSETLVNGLRGVNSFAPDGEMLEKIQGRSDASNTSQSRSAKEVAREKGA
jgi:hypothetical protein